MTLTALARWLQAPPITGRLALLCGLCIVAVPTGVRAAINGAVTGCEFTPYLPFVLLAAILLPWWQAGIVALASVAILGGLFSGPGHQLMAECFLTGAGVFLASSTLLVGVVVLIRQVFSATHLRGCDETAGGVVFSLEKNEVWASWYDQGPPVRLGSKQKVEAMMEDFLAQVEVAKRLKGEH
nr:hypothetical protein [uncultured bacterium]